MNVSAGSSSVNTVTNENNSRFTGFRLVATVIRRPRTGDEIFCLPLCAVCDKPITDFTGANLVVFHPNQDDDDIPPLEPLADLGHGEQLLKIPGAPFAVHKACDRDHWKPWKPLHTVLKSDQRYDWEKRYQLQMSAPPKPKRPRGKKRRSGTSHEVGRSFDSKKRRSVTRRVSVRSPHESRRQRIDSFN